MSEKRKPKKGVRPATRVSASSSPMDVDLLEQIVQLMASHDLNTVDVRDGDRRVILKRGAPTFATTAAPAAPVMHSQAPAPAAKEATPADDEAGYHRIISPMVGTFYTSPKPGEKVFVSVGSRVKPDTDVCIIEAMKTFNNIKAECSGTIARILVQDGQTVEFGTVLFTVKP